jgi:hypothetical protein
MGTTLDSITPALAGWIAKQHLFFVATAPLAGDGHVNCSPKGLDSLRILGSNRVAYLDLTGSGAETIAHVRENGRIVFMFCAFTGAPRIVRLHGHATVVTKASPDWTAVRAAFPEVAGIRSVIVATIARVGDSCGYAVPKFDFVDDRDALVKWAASKGDEGLAAYRRAKNSVSVDGLPALEDGDL